MVPALLGPCIKPAVNSLLAAQMHGGFRQFGVLVLLATSRSHPPRWIFIHLIRLSLSRIFSFSGWLPASVCLACWLPWHVLLSLYLSCLSCLSPSPPISLLFSLALVAPSSLSLPPPACCSELGSCKNSPPYLHVQHALRGHEHGLRVTIGVHQRVSAFE